MWKPATTLAWMLIVSACDGVQRDPGSCKGKRPPTD